MLKIYAIKGVVERYICVPFGKGSATLHFKGGALDSAVSRDATLTTSNLAEQMLIENLPQFKKGVIKIQKVIQNNPKPAEVFPETNIQSAPAEVFPDVTNLQSARAVLEGMGVSIERLQTKADVLKQAKEQNVSFPNWK